MQKNLKISVIIKTYNWPEALSLVLKSLNQQKTKYKFEVIIADDGSNSQTLSLINNLKNQLKYQLKHIWHEDLGFRASTILNKAIIDATGEYCVFVDGDCVCPKNFIEKHGHLAEKNYFVAGSRILISEKQVKHALQENTSANQFNLPNLIKLRLSRNCNKVLPLISLPLNKLRKISPNKWKNAKGCNLGIWREDLLKINGFDQRYEGWGHEDSDLIIRLINSGIKRKSGKFAATVIHLGHPFLDRSNQKQNFENLMATLKEKKTEASIGIDAGIEELL